MSANNFALTIGNVSPEFRVDHKANRANDGRIYSIVSAKIGANLRKVRPAGSEFANVSHVTVNGAQIEFLDSFVSRRTTDAERVTAPDVLTVETSQRSKVANLRLVSADERNLVVRIVVTVERHEGISKLAWNYTVAEVAEPTVSDWADLV